MKRLLNKYNEIKKDKNSIIYRLVHGVFWNIVGTVFAKSFTVFASIFVARYLGVKIYGEYGMINSTVITFSTLAGLSMGVTSTRFIAKYKIDDPEKTSKIIGLTNIITMVTGSLMMLSIFLLADTLSKTQLNAPHLAPILKIASVLLLINSLNGVQTGSLSGFEAFKSIALNSMVQGIIAMPVIITLTYFFNLKGLIFANILINLTSVVINRVALHRVMKKYKVFPDYKNCFKEIKILWEFSLPATISGVMIGPVVWYSNTIIANIQNGYAQLGLFNAAYQWRSFLQLLPQMIGSIMLPMIVSTSNKTNNKLERINVLLNWFIVIILSTPLIAFPEFIAKFYGKQYNSFDYLVVIAFTAFVCCVIAYKEGIARKLVSENLMWWGFLSNALWAVLFIGSVFLTKQYGAVGLSFSYVIAYILNTLIFVPFYIKRNVIPKDLIVSKEVLISWALIITLVLTTIFKVNIIIRGFSAVIIVFVLVMLIYNIYKKGNRKEGLG